MGLHQSVSSKVSGSKIYAIEQSFISDTSFEEIDEYLTILKSKKSEWAQKITIPERIKLLEKTLKNVEHHSEAWAKLDLEARHIPKDHSDEGASYAQPGMGTTLIRTFINTLNSLNKGRLPTQGLKTEQEGDRVTIHVYPTDFKDKLSLPGFHSEIHLEHGTTKENLKEYEAINYKDPNYDGGVSMVLAAGNVAVLGLTDTLHNLIVEKQVVLLKIHPVLEYCYELFQKILEPFISGGYVRIVRGGAKVGSYLVHHPSIDSIHMTGSDKTFEAIVYGTGEEARHNKSTDTRIINKTVTGELGCVTPVIIVPGNWQESDFDRQARNILTFLGALNGYACNAARVLVLPKNWSGSEKLLKKISEKMEQAMPPVNYYPGTNETIKEAMTCYPDMEKHGVLDDAHQPWMFVKNLNPENAESAFRREYWSSFLAQTFIDAPTTESFLDKAVEFVNEKLWGTLSAAIIIDSKTQKKLTKSKFLKKTIDNLRYGTVSINIAPGFSFFLKPSPWGGYPGSTYKDIQSGNCYVQNPYLLSKIEKSVIYAPFWFGLGKYNLKTQKLLFKFRLTNKFSDLARFLKTALIGG